MGNPNLFVLYSQRGKKERLSNLSIQIAVISHLLDFRR